MRHKYNLPPRRVERCCHNRRTYLSRPHDRQVYKFSAGVEVTLSRPWCIFAKASMRGFLLLVSDLGNVPETYNDHFLIDAMFKIYRRSRLKSAYEHKARLRRSGVDRDSDFYGTEFSEVPSSGFPCWQRYSSDHCHKASKTILSRRSMVHTMCSRLWFAFVR